MIPKSTEIRFEVTTHCQYNCKICNNDKLRRPREVMSTALFKELLDRILSETDQYKVVSFAGLGEPLIDPGFIKKIEYVKEKGLQSLLVTNGDLLTIQKFLELQEAGLYSVRVSFHGATPHLYSIMHGVIIKKYYTVKQQLHKILEWPDRKTKVLLTHVVINGINGHEIEEWKKLWSNKADLMEVWRVHNWADLFKHRDIQEQQNSTCGRLEHGPLQIQVDGGINACCFDYDGKLEFGNLKDQTLKEIFESKKFCDLMAHHTTGKFNGSGYICKRCEQRNVDKTEALIYSTGKIENRVDKTSTAYDNFNPKPKEAPDA